MLWFQPHTRLDCPPGRRDIVIFAAQQGRIFEIRRTGTSFLAHVSDAFNGTLITEYADAQLANVRAWCESYADRHQARTPQPQPRQPAPRRRRVHLRFRKAPKAPPAPGGAAA